MSVTVPEGMEQVGWRCPTNGLMWSVESGRGSDSDAEPVFRVKPPWGPDPEAVRVLRSVTDGMQGDATLALRRLHDEGWHLARSDEAQLKAERLAGMVEEAEAEIERLRSVLTRIAEGCGSSLHVQWARSALLDRSNRTHDQSTESTTGRQ